MTENVKPLPSTPGEGRGPRITNPDPPRSTSRSPERQQSPNKNKNTNKNKKIVEDDEDDFEFFHEFNREKVKDVIHHITTFLKQNAMDIEYLMIPFRPEQNNEKLLKFLNAIFPLGNGQPVNEKSQLKIINKTDVWTLFQSLKYIWCRLPNAEIVGWKAYLKFKYKEINKKYPQKAFLEIMPQCLESPNHASIVYDFFDLIVTLSSNSRVNKMSARKISKMCAIWAFKRANIKNEDGEDIMNDTSNSPSFDFDANNPKHGTINNSFQDGLNEWIPGSDAMFHLLLAFLKSFVPKDLESSKLPKSLKSILFNNEYPPKGSTAYSSQTILTIPLVTLYTDQFSRKPWQLLERCNELLDFSDYDAFEAREDYALLKSLFKKKNNVEGISRKMSQESRRLMKIMSTKHSTFQAGWAPRQSLANKFHQKENIQIKRVDIDDYFIWSWLSTLSYEETSEKKKIFGRSLILEFEFDGFKKWVIFQECDITLHYESLSQLKDKQLELQGKKEDIEIDNSNEEPKRIPLPKVRDANPVYEKFQKEVPNISVMKTDHSTLNNPSTTPQGQYHTVIDKSSLQKSNKNNLHTLEEKISKWNPLHNLRKKSNSNASQRSGSESSSEMRTEFASSSVYDPIQSRSATSNVYMEAPSKTEPRVISQYSILDPQKYKLPAINNEEEGFSIDLSQIGIETDDIQPITQEPRTNHQPPRNYNSEAPHNVSHVSQPYQHVKPQVITQPTLPVPQQPQNQPIPPQLQQSQPQSTQQYISEQNLSVQNNVPPPLTLEKPTEPAYMSQTSIASSSNSSSDHKGRYSATETLEELSGMVEDMIIHDDEIKVQAEKTFEDMTKFNQYKPKNFDGECSTSSLTHSLKINTPIDEDQRSLPNLNANINTTNYRERINFSDKTIGVEVPTQRDDYQESNNGTSSIGYQSGPTYENTGFVSDSSQRGRIGDIQYSVRQNQSTSPVRIAQQQSPSRSPERGRVPQVQPQPQQVYNHDRMPQGQPQSPSRSPERGRMPQGQAQSPNRSPERGRGPYIQPQSQQVYNDDRMAQGQAQSPNRSTERGRMPQGQPQSSSRSAERGRMAQGQAQSPNRSAERGRMPQGPPQSQQVYNGDTMPQGQPQPQQVYNGDTMPQGQPQPQQVYNGDTMPQGQPQPQQVYNGDTMPQGQPQPQQVYNGDTMPQGQPQPQQGQYSDGYMGPPPSAPLHQQYHVANTLNQQGRPPIGHSMSPARQNASPIRQNMPVQQQMGPTHLSPQYSQPAGIINNNNNNNNKYGQSQPQLAVSNNTTNRQRSPQPHSASPIYQNYTQPAPIQQNYTQALPPQQKYNQPVPPQQNYTQAAPMQQMYNAPAMNDGVSYLQANRPRSNNNNMNQGAANGMILPAQYQHQHHPLSSPGIPAGMPTNRSAQLDGYAGYVHPSPNNNNNNNVGSATIPVAIPHNNVGMKLHGNNINKRQERKQLYNNIRSGNFGI
ncbi:morphogenesis-related protein Msb1p [Monosporozyma servazzii]